LRPARRFGRWPGRLPHHAPEEVLAEQARIGRTANIREVVFGAQDGLLTTLGVVQGVQAANFSQTTILVAGFAAAVSGMVAMAIGEYLAATAERDLIETEVESERRSARDNPEREIEEMELLLQRDGATEAQARDIAARMEPLSELWFKTHVQKELGLTLGAQDHPVRNALVMGISFLLASLFPIAPHFLLSGWPAILASVIVTLVALATVGLIKSQVVGRSAARAVAQTVVLGLVAATVAYAAGTAMPRLFGLGPVPVGSTPGFAL
jgi:VIT1/CCC1 family predicted Fe2+/Mn2+ transporter